MAYDFDIRTLVGRLGRDPELKTVAGKSLVEFSIGKGNGKDKESEWINCKAWEKTADFIKDSVHKGDMVLVSGRTSVETWVKPDGTKGSKSVLNIRDFQLLTAKSGKVEAEEAPASPDPEEIF